MKILVLYSLVAIVIATPLAAQQHAHPVTIGIQVGTDIGGAVPVPFKYLPEAYNPYLNLNLSLGATAGLTLDPSWSVHAEVIYKTVSLNADARVKNQKFQDKDAIQYFTGSAYMQQRFTLLEVPVNATYHLCNDRDRFSCGFYYARVIEAMFHVKPRKGFIGFQPDIVDAPVAPDMEVMRFDDSLDSWDAGVIAGYDHKLFPHVLLGLRFSWGFKDIFKRGNRYFDYRMTHARGSVILAYNLFHFP